MERHQKEREKYSDITVEQQLLSELLVNYTNIMLLYDILAMKEEHQKPTLTHQKLTDQLQEETTPSEGE